MCCFFSSSFLGPFAGTCAECTRGCVSVLKVLTSYFVTIIMCNLSLV